MSVIVSIKQIAAVDGCNGCSFKNNPPYGREALHSCQHPENGRVGYGNILETQNNWTPGWTIKTPEWCPLGLGKEA